MTILFYCVTEHLPNSHFFPVNWSAQDIKKIIQEVATFVKGIDLTNVKEEDVQDTEEVGKDLNEVVVYVKDNSDIQNELKNDPGNINV